MRLNEAGYKTSKGKFYYKTSVQRFTYKRNEQGKQSIVLSSGFYVIYIGGQFIASYLLYIYILKW